MQETGLIQRCRPRRSASRVFSSTPKLRPVSRFQRRASATSRQRRRAESASCADSRVSSRQPSSRTSCRGASARATCRTCRRASVGRRSTLRSRRIQPAAFVRRRLRSCGASPRTSRRSARPSSLRRSLGGRYARATRTRRQRRHCARLPMSSSLLQVPPLEGSTEF